MPLPLTPQQTLTLLRTRYPDALACTRCAVLLATQRSSYRLSEPERLAYVCAECRQDEVQAARVAEVRAETGRRNIVLARATMAARASMQPAIQSPSSDAHADEDLQSRLIVTPQPLAHRRRKGGRPRVGALIQLQKARDRARAHRQRRRTTVPA
jgi:hypothetical protein